MPEPDDPKPEKPTTYDRACEILEIMDVNGWKQADAARYLGISRARVTQILNVLKNPIDEIDLT